MDNIEEKKTKVRRPLVPNAELTRAIALEIATNTCSIGHLCDRNKHWPTYRMFYRWLVEHQEFADAYANAKRAQIQLLVDEIVQIADFSHEDDKFASDGSLVPNKEYIARSRLRIDTRKWMAAKLIPRLYGDRVIQEISGRDGNPIQLSNIDVGKLTDEQLS